MLLSLIRKEIVLNVLSLRFAVTFVLFFVLTMVSIFAMTRSYQRALDTHESSSAMHRAQVQKTYEASTEGLVAESTERDGRVHADDCLEVFFDTNRDARSYFQFIINTLGTVSDTHYGHDRPGQDWNGSVTIGTTVADTFWVAEVAIPASTLDGASITKGDIWGFNIAGVRTGNASEYGQWVPTYGLALRPDRFGYLLFE